MRKHNAEKSRPEGARFWDRIASRYDAKPVPDENIYETKLAKTNRLLKPSYRVLEVGCGTGTTAIRLAPYAKSIVAIDYSEQMINIARAKACAANSANVEFQTSSVGELSDDRDNFDVVLAHSVLHLVEDVGSTLRRLHLLLKPGGVLISTTPCIRDFFPLFRHIGRLGSALRLMPRINVFGEAQLEQWFQNAGFNIEERWLPGPKTGLFLIASKSNGCVAQTERLRIVAK